MRPSLSLGVRRTRESLLDNLIFVHSNPPRCLASYLLAAARMPDASWDGHGEELNPVFLVQCTCGGTDHAIHGFSWQNPDYPESAVFLSPIDLACTSCTKRSLLIDTDLHGYDAELGHGSTTVRGEGDPTTFQCESCGGDSMKTLIRFEYPPDVFGPEFNEFAGSRSDLFTWVTVVGRCTGCDGLWTVADFECA